MYCSDLEGNCLLRALQQTLLGLVIDTLLLAAAILHSLVYIYICSGIYRQLLKSSFCFLNLRHFMRENWKVASLGGNAKEMQRLCLTCLYKYNV